MVPLHEDIALLILKRTIRAALSLFWPSGDTAADQHLVGRLAKAPYRADSIEVQSLIIEGEMCAFNEALGRIDEFWKIQQAKFGKGSSIEDSQNSTQTTDSHHSTATTTASIDYSPEIAMHLILVFFDVLMLNGRSLLRSVFDHFKSSSSDVAIDTYQERVKLLDRIVRPIEGYVSALLAAREMLILPAEHARCPNTD